MSTYDPILHSADAPLGVATVYDGLISVEDFGGRDDFQEMVLLLQKSQPLSGSHALALLRGSYPHVPLARRVAAVEAARR